MEVKINKAELIDEMSNKIAKFCCWRKLPGGQKDRTSYRAWENI